MKRIVNDRSFRLSFLLTLIFFGTGIVFLFAGLVNYSWILFILLPVVLGFAIGALPNRRWSIYGSFFCALFLLMGLWLGGLSGFICIMMSLAPLIAFIFLGMVITHLVRRYKHIASTDKLPILILPLFVFLLAAPAERFLKKERKQVVEVKTERVYPYDPQQVYDAIKSVDTLIAEKPLLMYFDLPVPVKCILSKEEVGGIRTCYFKEGNLSNGEFGGGTITEKITELQKGKVLKMDVTGYNLTGRKWLGFQQAIYYFDSLPAHSCKLTRITTYTSELTPRLYWEPVEKIAIEQEHAYVFNNLMRDLQKRYGK